MIMPGKLVKRNTTPDGQVACVFGTPWLDHWDPPMGSGRGCTACDAETYRDGHDHRSP